MLVTVVKHGNNNSELKHATFLSHGRQPEVHCFPVFLFNFSPDHHIYIVKSLFTSGDD